MFNFIFLVLLCRKQEINAQEITSVFVLDPVPDDVVSVSVNGSVDMSDDQDDDAEAKVESSPVPADCTVIEEVEFVTCGGRGSVDGLLIPTDTKSGTYVLEVLDNVDELCLRKSTTTGPESESVESKLNPVDLAPLCKLVPSAGSSLMSFKLVVE